MDINFSQTGQDFAVTQRISQTDPEQNKSVQEEAQSKVSTDSADREKLEQAEINVEQLEVATSELSQFMQNNSRQLNFSIDEGSNKQVVEVTDSNSGEVIRQIPSEEVLKLSERLQDLQTEIGSAVGLLFDKQA